VGDVVVNVVWIRIVGVVDIPNIDGRVFAFFFGREAWGGKGIVEDYFHEGRVSGGGSWVCCMCLLIGVEGFCVWVGVCFVI
jgi:hypothetical protein